MREVEAGILSLGDGIRKLPQAEPAHHILRAIGPSYTAAAVSSERVIHIFAHSCCTESVFEAVAKGVEHDSSV